MNRILENLSSPARSLQGSRGNHDPNLNWPGVHHVVSISCSQHTTSRATTAFDTWTAQKWAQPGTRAIARARSKIAKQCCVPEGHCEQCRPWGGPSGTYVPVTRGVTASAREHTREPCTEHHNHGCTALLKVMQTPDRHLEHAP